MWSILRLPCTIANVRIIGWISENFPPFFCLWFHGVMRFWEFFVSRGFCRCVEFDFKSVGNGLWMVELEFLLWVGGVGGNCKMNGLGFFFRRYGDLGWCLFGWNKHQIHGALQMPCAQNKTNWNLLSILPQESELTIRFWHNRIWIWNQPVQMDPNQETWWFHFELDPFASLAVRQWQHAFTHCQIGDRH